MRQPQPVPKLDLAPKLKRPLSLWNPLDYLRLLYWVFYFPQAIRWYVNVIAGKETDFSDTKTWREKLRWFFENPIQARLWMQGFVLQIAFPFLICYLLEAAGASVSWASVAGGVAGSVAAGVAAGVAGSVGVGVAGGVAGSVGAGVGVLRPENWMWGLRPGTRRFQQQRWFLPHITPLPIPSIARQLSIWMQQDWQAGLEIANELLKYTQQFIPVIQSVNFILLRTEPDVLIPHVASLSNSIWDQKTVKYASASLNDALT